MKIRRGDILYADLGGQYQGSMQGGMRPVVVVSNNMANKHSTVITVVPLSTKIFKKKNLPTHVFVSAYRAEGLEQHSIAICEQVTALDMAGLLRTWERSTRKPLQGSPRRCRYRWGYMISITDKKSKAGRSVPAFYIQRFVCHRTICKLNRMKQAEDRRTKVLDISEEKLDAMAAVDIRTVDINTLTDIRNIKIDTKLPVEEKLDSFARQTNNIYVHRMGDYVVKVRFQKEGASIDDKMEEYLRHLAEIHI